MANPRKSRIQIDPALIEQAHVAVKKHGSARAAAQALGISRSTLRGRLKMQRPAAENSIEMPDFPDDGLTAEEIIEHQCKAFEKRRASYDAHTWFPVKLKTDEPIGILWFGDPHVDDNGCNWPLLREHVRVCRETPGLYGANIGDTTNNWSGRLVKLYANQDTSVKTARKLAKWFMLESGIDWIVWLLGNHDQWGDGSTILAQMGAEKIVCHDWEARFRVVFPNKRECRVWAAHDFPGHSQWNPLHAGMKAAQMKAEADLYICGHKHNWASIKWENAERGSTPLVCRVRGYKYMDEYARNLGITEQKEGAGILTIINPKASLPSSFVREYTDVQEGADFLTWLRSRS